MLVYLPISALILRLLYWVFRHAGAQSALQGAHLLLQVRIKTLNNELKGCFNNWYPEVKVVNEETTVKAA